MKTTINDYLLEHLLEVLQTKLQNAIDLKQEADGVENLYSRSYFCGCQAAYRTAIEDIRMHLIEAPKAAKKSSINPSNKPPYETKID